MVRWIVRSDQIDHDQWAKAALRALSGGAPGSRAVVRWWTWPAIVLLIVAIAALVDVETVAIALLPALVVIGLLVGLQVTGQRRLVRRLERTPSASEGFTFTADAIGTSRTGPAGSDQLPWSRYKAVRLDGDVITLLLDTNTVTVLPVVALEGPTRPDDAVARIDEWIAGSRADPN